MKKQIKKILVIMFIVCNTLLNVICVDAHSGRTDAYGGHKDNQNKSGLGSYHYHCGGYPAHIHQNGVCPYSSSSKNNTQTTKKVVATSIEIDEKDVIIDVNKTLSLTATIYPKDIDNKNITWESSNENVAKISSSGKITAVSPGIVTITASTSNGKENTIKVVVLDNIDEDKNTVIPVVSNNVKMNDDNNLTTNMQDDLNDKEEENDVLIGMAGLGIICGGYYIYKKKKNK